MSPVAAVEAPPSSAPDLALDVGPARRTALARVVAVAVAVAAALPWSLRALVGDFRYAGALGDLALIPVCALLLALVAAWLVLCLGAALWALHRRDA